MDLIEPNTMKDWLSDKAWNDVLSMCELPAFHEFKQVFKSNEEKVYYTVPHRTTLCYTMLHYK